MARTVRSITARDAGAMVLVGAAYYAAARFGLHLAVIQMNVTPLWPPTGIAVVAFLVFGRRAWPGIVRVVNRRAARSTRLRR